MKKLLFAILLAGSAHTSFAQFSSPTKATFGVKGGANFANIQFSSDEGSGSLSFGTLTTFSAGVFTDVPFSESFSVQTGIFYSRKGTKLDDISVDFDQDPNFNGSVVAKTKTHIAYVQVPVHLLFNAPVSGGKFFIGVGPYAAVAIKAYTNGVGESTFTAGGVTTTDREDIYEKIEIGKNDGIKRIDYGATALAGFRFNNGISLSANYDLGLANISMSTEGEKSKNRVIGVSLGFSF